MLKIPFWSLFVTQTEASISIPFELQLCHFRPYLQWFLLMFNWVLELKAVVLRNFEGNLSPNWMPRDWVGFYFKYEVEIHTP
jgi:hypothetical protein